VAGHCRAHEGALAVIAIAAAGWFSFYVVYKLFKGQS
jgi:hypothetical protein